jgi:hypothetical protein
MKKAIKVFIILLLAPVLIYALLYLVCAVVPKLDSYDFPYRGETIESVELLYYPWADDHKNGEFMQFQTIRKLEPNEIPAFMDSIYELPTESPLGDPRRDFGPYIAVVTYQNGDAEYYGSWNIEIVEAGSEIWAVGQYCFSGDAFDKLFLEYAKAKP